MPANLLLAIDAPDPDNFAALWVLDRLYPDAEIAVLLTGRPVMPREPEPDHPLHHNHPSICDKLHHHNAFRVYDFAAQLDRDVCVYDGGIAPRTLVPHKVHMHEGDFPLRSTVLETMRPTHELADRLAASPSKSWKVVLGGPATGLLKLAGCLPAAFDAVREIHAMFATWGDAKLMDVGGQPRGTKQFNVACDPIAARYLLQSIGVPIFLYPTEVTRLDSIAYDDPVSLRAHLLDPQDRALDHLCAMYDVWYEKAIAPRPGEKIYLHDVAPALGSDETLRRDIYLMRPATVPDVPVECGRHSQWGEATIVSASPAKATCTAAHSLAHRGAEMYRATLRSLVSGD